MKRLLTSLAIVYAAFVLEVAGVGASATGVEPRWLLLATAWCLWTQRLSLAALWGAACGLLMESLGSGGLGAGMLLVASLAWGIGSLRASRRWKSLTAFLLCTFLVTALGAGGFDLLARGSLPSTSDNWRTCGLLWCGQGAVTALWGCGMWMSTSGAARLSRYLLSSLSGRRQRLSAE
jgi:cell shape-determining protein MreD